MSCLRTVLLTTETNHHLYYAWKVNERFSLTAILVESRRVNFGFDTYHRFEEERDEYERQILLAGGPKILDDVTTVHRFESANNSVALSLLRNIKPEIILVFGTGRLERSVIEIPSIACLNLHGGNPEEYRGLDSHLWAIYHNDFASLVTTLHHVDRELDTGDIISRKQLVLTKDSKIYQLRSINTQACVDLSIIALDTLQSTGVISSDEQNKKGRYYSAMPAVLKEVCVRNFQKYVASL